ncbi:MAG: hypothetical protein ACK5OX_02380 [Desertimonas sp.]
MTDKPSYLGLLNAVAVAERQAGEYLNCWADTTADPAVRATIRTVALREAEHGLAFAKRIDELGFEVIDKPDRSHTAKLKTAASTELTDLDKFELLGLGTAPQTGRRDVFDSFFENKDLDPVTGGLLGRYIAEERDSARRLAGCHQALAAASPSSKGSKKKSSKKKSSKSSKKK